MKYILAYDITKNRTRAKLVRTLLEFGIRTQYSVFEAELSSHEAQELSGKISNLVDVRKDKIFFFPITPEIESNILRAGWNVDEIECNDIFI